MNKTLKAHLALLIANLIYAASFTIAKIVTPQYIMPFGFVLMRVIGAASLFWITGTFFIKEKVETKDIKKFALLAVFGVTTNQLMFLKGLSLTTPISAAIMMITTPILVLIIANVIIKEKITITKSVGILIGFIGAALLMFGQEHIENTDGHSLLGDFCIFINAISWGTYLVLVKPLMKKYHTVTILKWVFLFGFVFVLPFGYKEFISVQWKSLATDIWIYALFIVIFVTYVAYLLNTYSLKELSPSVVSAYIYLQPVLASVIALFADKDELSSIKILSAFMIFAGVYLVSKK